MKGDISQFEQGGEIMQRLYTRKEASELLGISLTTLDLARKTGQIAFVQYMDNGKVFFTEEGLNDYLSNFTHQALSRKRENYSARTDYESGEIPTLRKRRK